MFAWFIAACSYNCPKSTNASKTINCKTNMVTENFRDFSIRDIINNLSVLILC